MNNDYTTIPEYKISWEECDRIVAHTLKFYKTLADESNVTHPNDLAYNWKLKESVDFILGYLGEADEN